MLPGKQVFYGQWFLTNCCWLTMGGCGLSAVGCSCGANELWALCRPLKNVESIKGKYLHLCLLSHMARYNFSPSSLHWNNFSFRRHYFLHPSHTSILYFLHHEAILSRSPFYCISLLLKPSPDVAVRSSTHSWHYDLISRLYYDLVPTPLLFVPPPPPWFCSTFSALGG